MTTPRLSSKFRGQAWLVIWNQFFLNQSQHTMHYVMLLIHHLLHREKWCLIYYLPYLNPLHFPLQSLFSRRNIASIPLFFSLYGFSSRSTVFTLFRDLKLTFNLQPYVGLSEVKVQPRGGDKAPLQRGGACMTAQCPSEIIKPRRKCSAHSRWTASGNLLSQESACMCKANKQITK